MNHDTLIAAAERDGATVLRTRGATIIVIPAPVADGDDLLSVDDAAEIAKCSLRMIREAHRTGALALFGKQRSRTVRRADLEAWIESRRVKPTSGADDHDIARRMRQIAGRS